MKIYGRNPVIERLRTNPKSIRKIFLQQGFKDSSAFRQKARKWGIPIILTAKSKMQKIGRNVNTQGIVIVVDPFEYLPFEDLLENAVKKKHTILLLDRINDPQNLGAILRSLACLGRFSVVLPTHESVSVTEVVLRIASGGENYVPVAKVSNLVQAIKKAKDVGYWIAGAVVDEGDDIYKLSLPSPVALVVGSEQKGIRDTIRNKLDVAITIPMFSETLSLNVAQAASILCYEITKQKKQKK